MGTGGESQYICATMSLFRKHQRLLWLIFSSLTLLGVFQVFWLRQVWKEQRTVLRQETDYIFQKTVLALQDSLVRRNMAKNNINPDSLHMPLPPPGPLRFKHWQYRQESKLKISIDNDLKVEPRDSVSKVQVFIATSDSMSVGQGEPGIDRMISRLVIPTAAGETGLIFKIEKDTIVTDTLLAVYRQALDKAGIALDFELQRFEEFPEKQEQDSAILRTEPAFSGLLTPVFYVAEFKSTEGYLLRKTLPHILFSLFLFGMTSAAFGLIFKSLRQQQRLTALKNDFIGNITHELKTPITTVGVALEALSDFEVLKNPEQTREYISISKLELERLTLLVDKVLRLSMFEDKQPRLQPESLDLTVLVRQVLNAMKLQAESTGAHIHLETGGEGPFVVNGDRLHLTSVVFNLVDNALKYRSKEPPVVKVSLNTMPGGRVCLSVEDNGIGIAPEYQPKIFEKFFRVPAGNVHNVKGHGLGLSYVAHVIQQHNGNIRVESPVRPDVSEGKGCRFVVELPGV